MIVRILVTMDDRIQKIQKKVDNAKEKLSINFHALDKLRQPNVTTLLVDMEYSLVVDIKDDSKENFEEAIGLSTSQLLPHTHPFLKRFGCKLNRMNLRTAR